MKLSRYIAHAGVCSRRKAAGFVKQGVVTVDDTVITEPWYDVQQGQIVKVCGKKILLQKKMYVLLNKPKDYLSTLADERGRKNVLSLIGPLKERLYPIGRLDRNTTGLLIMTNDGDLTQRLAHPKNQVKKVYHVVLDAPLRAEDVRQIARGVRLNDGRVDVDELLFIAGRTKDNVLVELHSGRYRIIRRLFAHLGFKVIKLDRLVYAGLTKKGLALGNWRFLTEDEVDLLMKYGTVEKDRG